MTRALTIACFATLAVLSAQVSAQDTSPPTAAPPATTTATETVARPAGNPEVGKSLAYTCQGCHGIDGYRNVYPTYHVPKIGGQSADYLVNALHEYQRGTRRHPTMQAQAQSFSDQDISDIAAFLSELTP